MSQPFYPAAQLAALLSFALVASVTPGPNNIMLMASGVNFGIRRTVPQMAGIFTGLAIITIGVGLGLGYLFTAFPLVRLALMALGIFYILFLAFKIATAGSLGGGSMAHPMSYGASLAFQWVNPKLWMMAVSAAALYVRPGHMLGDTGLLAVVYAVINIPAMLLWAGFGVGLRRALEKPRRVRIFNLVMALLLAGSVLAFLKV